MQLKNLLLSHTRHRTESVKNDLSVSVISIVIELNTWELRLETCSEGCNLEHESHVRKSVLLVTRRKRCKCLPLSIPWRTFGTCSRDHVPSILPIYRVHALFILLNPSILRSPFIFTQYTAPRFLLVVHFPRRDSIPSARARSSCCARLYFYFRPAFPPSPAARYQPNFSTLRRLHLPRYIFPLVENYKSDEKRSSWQRIEVKRRLFLCEVTWSIF